MNNERDHLMAFHIYNIYYSKQHPIIHVHLECLLKMHAHLFNPFAAMIPNEDEKKLKSKTFLLEDGVKSNEAIECLYKQLKLNNRQSQFIDSIPFGLVNLTLN